MDKVLTSKHFASETLDIWVDHQKTELPTFLGEITPEVYPSIYAMHRYWSRKPYNVVAEYIKHFTKPGDVVLDPFVGSGVTAIESLIARRKAVAVDLNPMAVFITKMTCIPVDISVLQHTFDSLKKKVLQTIDRLYETRCTKCGKNAIATHTLWKDSQIQSIRFNCSHCSTKGKKSPDQADLEHTRYLEQLEIGYWYPKQRLFRNSRINVSANLNIPDLFSKRNLYALSYIYKEIEAIENDEVRNILKFTFTSSVSQASKMVFVVRRRGRQQGKITETEEVGSRVIGYWLPDEHFEIHAWNCFENRFKKILLGKEDSKRLIGSYYNLGKTFSDLGRNSTLLLLNQSSENLSSIPSESIDYVFTDPPFGDQVPYLELDAMWSYWLKYDIDFENELVISNSPERKKDYLDYKKKLENIFNELYRVLKHDRYMSVMFYNYDLKVWHALISTCIDIGFSKFAILPSTNSHPSIVQLYRSGGTKGSLVVTFKKNSRQKIAPNPPKSKSEMNYIVVDAVNSVLDKYEKANTYQIYDAIVMALINNNALEIENKIPTILKDNFAFDNGFWRKKAT